MGAYHRYQYGKVRDVHPREQRDEKGAGLPIRHSELERETCERIGGGSSRKFNSRSRRCLSPVSIREYWTGKRKGDMGFNCHRDAE